MVELYVFLSQSAFFGGMPSARVDRYRAPKPFLRARLCGTERAWDAGQVIDSTSVP